MTVRPVATAHDRSPVPSPENTMRTALAAPAHAPAADAVAVSAAAPTGFRASLRQLGLTIVWNWQRGSDVLPLLAVVQIRMAVLTVFGYGLLVGDAPVEAARFLATGAATVNLIMVGLVITPQGVATAKTEGSLAWMRTLPTPRWVDFAADAIIYMVLALPGGALGLLAGAWHFGVDLSLSPWLILAAPLVAVVSATVGYSIALLLHPSLANLVSQVLVFVVLMFAPISIPTERFPDWLSTVHEWLPIAPMADLMRATLLSDVFTMPGRSVAVLAVWTVLCLTGVGAVLRKRS